MKKSFALVLAIYVVVGTGVFIAALVNPNDKTKPTSTLEVSVDGKVESFHYNPQEAQNLHVIIAEGQLVDVQQN